MNKNEIAAMIDHTLLAPDATKDQIIKLCKEADENKFASVCVNPCFIRLCAEQLKNSTVKVCTVIGFPLGSMTRESKVFEAADAVEKGAEEVDMVLNVSAVKEGRYEDVLDEVKAVTAAVKGAGIKAGKNIVLKVILETCYLTDDQIVESCKAVKAAGADFVKTSTGFAIIKDKDGKLLPNGATEHAVEIMRKTVGPDFGVKASGGIRGAEAAAAMVKAGANRIGTSSGVKIVQNL